METFNTIHACHVKFKDNECIIAKKVYTWHIPKKMREANLKEGDFVLVEASKTKAPVIVINVFREEKEDTGTKYRKVVGKLKKREGTILRYAENIEP